MPCPAAATPFCASTRAASADTFSTFARHAAATATPRPPMPARQPAAEALFRDNIYARSFAAEASAGRYAMALPQRYTLFAFMLRYDVYAAFAGHRRYLMPCACVTQTARG